MARTKKTKSGGSNATGDPNGHCVQKGTLAVVAWLVGDTTDFFTQGLDVSVSPGGVSGTTDDKGVKEFTELVTNTYTIAATLSGAKAGSYAIPAGYESKKVSLPAGSTMPVNFDVVQLASLTVRVKSKAFAGGALTQLKPQSVAVLDAHCTPEIEQRAHGTWVFKKLHVRTVQVSITLTAADAARHRSVVNPPPLKLVPGDANTLNVVFEEEPPFTAGLVNQITFAGVVPIWYARIEPGDARSVFLAPVADRPVGSATAKSFKPVVERPAPATPHWKRSSPASTAEFSWPAVYVRTGSNGGTQKLTVDLELAPNPVVAMPPSVTVRVAASSPAGVSLALKDVPFTNGKAVGVSFDFATLPATVSHLSGFDLNWTFECGGRTFPGFTTKHTLFIVDAKPLNANFQDDVPASGFENKWLWEMLVWATSWAAGKSGAAAVRTALWTKFSPVAAADSHASGLVYWKNHNAVPKVRPNQHVPEAIRSRDAPEERKRDAASCIVFDRLWIGVLAAHGIAACEIKLVVRPVAFKRGAVDFESDPYNVDPAKRVEHGWAGTTAHGQGNPTGPPGWASHWIAAVQTSAGVWELYDSSYGIGNYTPCATPGALFTTHLIAWPYQQAAVAGFRAVRKPPVAPLTIDSLTPDASEPPKLEGFILWKP